MNTKSLINIPPMLLNHSSTKAYLKIVNLQKLISLILISLLTLSLQSCGNDEENPKENNIKGTWLLTNYSYRYHYFLNDTWWDDIKDESVTSYYWYNDGMGFEPTKYMEHLTFDNNNVSVWLAEYPLPTMPKFSQYDNTPAGQLEYAQAFNDWEIAIRCINKGFPWHCPYTIKGNNLYIGILYNGDIEFTSSDSFTLTYRDTAFDKKGEYKLYKYTFKKNSTL